MTQPFTSPSPEALAILNALQDAVTKCLDKKKRPGQYAVIWRDGRPMKLNPDGNVSEITSEPSPNPLKLTLFAPKKQC